MSGTKPCDCGSCCAWAEVLDAINPIIQADLARAYHAKYAPPGFAWFRNDSGEDQQVSPA